MSLTNGEGTPFTMPVAPVGASNNGNGGFGGWGGDALIALIMMFLFPMIYGGMGWGGENDMEKLKEKLWEELEEIARKPEMGAGDLELVHKLSDTIKNLDKICMLEGEDSGYSSANRGQHYVRGHYSRDGGMDGVRSRDYSSRRDSRGRYSRSNGRSEMMEYIEMALDAADDKARETIKRFMRQLENA